MEPISNSDRVLALLRQRLKERSDVARKAARNPSNSRPPMASGLTALARLSGLNREQMRRACVQALLADQFGHDMLNDARFQQVVSRVTETLNEDSRAAALLDRVLADLQSGHG